MNVWLRRAAVWFVVAALAGLWLLLAKEMETNVAQASLKGLLHALSWPAVGYMVLGIFIGFWVGILPGLGGPVTLALMLGFAFQLKLTPTETIALLLGMIGVVATTGDITSILFGVPGEATTASTIIEGHPMAKRGEAGRALGASLISSLMGALTGAVALALAIPVVYPVVMALGLPEFFMFTLAGIAFVGSLSGRSVLRGLAAGGIGFLFAMVGLDSQTATERYTFGILYLWGTGGGGIGLIPATVGLFAIPEIIELAVKGGSIAEVSAGKLGGVFQGVKDVFRHWWLVLRCSALGSYIGLLPGMGSAVSQWVAYAYAMQSSGKQDRVGTGQVEGVLGPSAANNSSFGGAMIPALAFGIPTNVVVAMFLAAFLMMGLVPGRDMLTKNLDITFSLIWVLILANIITVTISFLFLNHLARLTRIRGSLLIPVLLILIYLGAYTDTNSFGDILVTLAFGGLGWLMVIFGWPRPALLLGLLLGRLAETYLWLAYSRYGFAFLGRPGVLFILMLIVASALFPEMRRRWRKGSLKAGR